MNLRDSAAAVSQGCDPRVRPAGAIVTGPGQHTDSLVLPLCPPGAISGRVVDDAGEPVEQARVELFRSAIVNGRRRVATIAVKQTADTGDFRFGALPAGTYYLAASGSPWYTKFAQTNAGNAPRDMTHAGYQIQYHSNASDPAAAEPLTLKAGQEATTNFVLLPVPAAAVHVHVAGKEDLSKRFALTVAGLPGSRVLVRQGTQSGDLYNFWGVPPGHYAVRVDASDASRAWYAEEEFDVSGTDIDVSSTLREVPSLAGTLEVEGGGQPTKLRIMLIDLESGNGQPLPSDANGRFSLSSISAQRYRVALSGGDDYYLKRWFVEGAGRDGEVLDLRKSSAVRLKVLAAKGAGRVKGTIQRDGQPLSGALIVLAPATGPAEQETLVPRRARAMAATSSAVYCPAHMPCLRSMTAPIWSMRTRLLPSRT